MDWQEYIELHTDVMLGKPVIKGTRLTVECILEHLAEGMSFEEVLEAHPNLKSEHIRAALAYAAAALSSELTVLSTSVR